ncbi:MAG: IS66 family insertion sequence element accessory protein TnpB [Candidatus Melainabacteria bacterium]|nr:IS66 family insertion sequence element accessory protein TnpB [Candidatus Melainabacteria bacterium]
MDQPQAIFYREPINIQLSPEKLADFVRWSGNKLDSGDVFIFFNRKRDRCKIIWHDGKAFCSLEKRLERGLFAANDKIDLTQSAIENCVYGGIAGQRELLHALMGNVIYLDDSRK